MDPNRVALFQNNFGGGGSSSPTTRRLTVSKIAITADKFTVGYVTGELLRIAKSVAEDQSAVYIHSQMRPKARPKLLGKFLTVDMESITTMDIQRGGADAHRNNNSSRLALCDRLCRLLTELKTSKEPLPEILQAFQVLMSFITTLLFTGGVGDSEMVEQKEDLLRHMREVSVRLLQDGPSMMMMMMMMTTTTTMPPADLSLSNRWHAWILAESVRRAILMTCLIQGVYHGWLRGYCYHEVFIQALPFDVRPGLWNAESEDEWEKSLMMVKNVRGWNTWSELVSFREFAHSFAESPFDPGQDTFQRLLLTAHHGKEPVDRTLGNLSVCNIMNW
ncbi:hypothetical protein H2204_004722 [Knufia peltigerae]|uniref:Uncharacterized protein n=1 Tax=Knufia peltigerae TaxID=1002370 RepID=A0AA38Y753_9EURO|nr:hypothetical protein H2204_004722 [Knufia peltigerae]